MPGARRPRRVASGDRGRARRDVELPRARGGRPLDRRRRTRARRRRRRPRRGRTPQRGQAAPSPSRRPPLRGAAAADPGRLLRVRRPRGGRHLDPPAALPQAPRAARRARPVRQPCRGAAVVPGGRRRGGDRDGPPLRARRDHGQAPGVDLPGGSALPELDRVRRPSPPGRRRRRLGAGARPAGHGRRAARRRARRGGSALRGPRRHRGDRRRAPRARGGHGRAGARREPVRRGSRRGHPPHRPLARSAARRPRRAPPLDRDRPARAPRPGRACARPIPRP